MMFQKLAHAWQSFLGRNHTYLVLAVDQLGSETLIEAVYGWAKADAKRKHYHRCSRSYVLGQRRYRYILRDRGYKL